MDENKIKRLGLLRSRMKSWSLIISKSYIKKYILNYAA